LQGGNIKKKLKDYTKSPRKGVNERIGVSNQKRQKSDDNGGAGK